MGGKASKAATTAITCTINGKSVSVPENTTVYQASKEVLPPHNRIPTLCYHPYLSLNDPTDGCGVCKAEVNGELVNSCSTLVENGMTILTGTPECNENIKAVLKNLLSTHPLECPTCAVNLACTFQDLLAQYGISPKDLNEEESIDYTETHGKMFSDLENYFGNFAVSLDASKCIVCKRCIRICEELQGMGVLSLKDGKVSAFSDNLENTECVSCGACTFVCPTGAIAVNSSVSDVSRLLRKKTMQLDESDLVLVASTAPAVRVTLAEDLGMNPGDLTEEQMVQGMRMLGFNHVFDTNFTADLTIMEEGFELIGRVGEGGPFPMFTSCCPAWINMMETQYPEFIPNVSSCKSPQQMMGALIKHYWADKVGLDKKKVFNVSIMPCTAKKDEIQRMQMEGDVDMVLTTRELAQLFKVHKIDVPSLEGELYDDPLGEGTGAAVIFGATGGVMEAALRTAYEVLTETELPDINFVPARGLEGIKEATVDVNGLELKVAIAHQGANIHALMDRIKNGEEYHFIEMMMCKGGCIGGGGNPKIKVDEAPLDGRMEAIYDLDANKYPLRKSHENESVQKLYKEFLGEPNSHLAHELLHTHYNDRKN